MLQLRRARVDIESDNALSERIAGRSATMYASAPPSIWKASINPFRDDVTISSNETPILFVEFSIQKKQTMWMRSNKKNTNRTVHDMVSSPWVVKSVGLNENVKQWDAHQ